LKEWSLTSSTGTKLAQIISGLRGYVGAHPHAADTLQGVSRWWLVGLDNAATLLEIEQALEALVTDGTIDRRQLPDGSVLYMARGS